MGVVLDIRHKKLYRSEMNYTSPSRRVGQNVRRLRQAADLSLRQLAALIDQIDFSALAKLEKGDRRVTVEDLEALGRALNVPPMLLFMEPAAGDEIGALIAQWENMTDELEEFRFGTRRSIAERLERLLQEKMQTEAHIAAREAELDVLGTQIAAYVETSPAAARFAAAFSRVKGRK